MITLLARAAIVIIFGYWILSDLEIIGWIILALLLSLAFPKK